MELVTPSCFTGLSEDEKQEQMYLAYYLWADNPDLLDPECFLGYPHRDEAMYAALYEQGGTVAPNCIEGLPPEEREKAAYEIVYALAEDDQIVSPECFIGLPPDERDLAYYTALYVIAGYDDLLNPACFLGSSPEDRRLAEFEAVSKIQAEPVNPIPELGPIMWLRADALVLEDEDPVSEWPDVSGNSNDATQPSMMQMPEYQSSGFNGHPSVRFDGIDDWLSIPIQNGIMQYFAVFRSTASLFNSYWGLIENAVTDNTFTRMGLFEAGQTYFHSSQYPSGVRKNGSTLSSPFDCAPILAPMILTVVPSTAGGGGTLVPWTRGIGCLGNIQFGSFSLAEIVAFGTIQTPENTALVEAYLAQKYSI